MKRLELLLRNSAWMQQTESSQIILSSRVRLARNLESIPFPHVLQPVEAKRTEQMLAQLLETIEAGGKKLEYFPLSGRSGIEQQVLIEKHLISPGLVNSQEVSGLALADDHRFAVMVNEEDHLRIQVLLPGNELSEAYRLANALDDELERQLDFAYLEDKGYLTACPTNVGTGLRASVMVHLPALVMTNQLQQVLGALTHLGLAVRGLYGEGSQAYGHLFQISNQITLGKSEEDILAHLEAVTSQVVEHELQAREVLGKQASSLIEDKVWRSHGILQNCRLLTSEDAVNLLSQDRLGVDMGILPKTNTSFAALLVHSQPGCLQYSLGRELEAGLRDAQRAKFMREAMESK